MLERHQVAMQVISPADRTAGDADLVAFERLADLVMADHSIVDDDRQAGADVVSCVDL